MTKRYVAKVKKDDRIHIKIGDEKVVEIHVKTLGSGAARLCIIREDHTVLHHEKSEKQA